MFFLQDEPNCGCCPNITDAVNVAQIDEVMLTMGSRNRAGISCGPHFPATGCSGKHLPCNRVAYLVTSTPTV